MLALSKREGPPVPLLDVSGLAGGRRSSRLDADRWACSFEEHPGQVALLYIMARYGIMDERGGVGCVTVEHEGFPRLL